MSRTKRGGPWFESLLRWFRAHARDLPWRKRSDWYSIVVAEVMLIRTRSEVVVRSYEEFMLRYPSPEALCQADDGELRRFFKALGLPERGPALKRLTCTVLEAYGGDLPCSIEELLKLPYVGRYVASVLLARVCGKPAVFVDTNVRRVVGRMTGQEGIPADRVEQLLKREVPKDLVGRVNLALLDLAHAFCKPRRPRCASCPLRGWCGYALRGKGP